VYNGGRFPEAAAHTPAGTKLAQRLCICDSEMIPNAIIYSI
jgi:salicylate 5-hydroxylase small subunit